MADNNNRIATSSYRSRSRERDRFLRRPQSPNSSRRRNITVRKTSLWNRTSRRSSSSSSSSASQNLKSNWMQKLKQSSSKVIHRKRSVSFEDDSRSRSPRREVNMIFLKGIVNKGKEFACFGFRDVFAEFFFFNFFLF